MSGLSLQDGDMSEAMSTLNLSTSTPILNTTKITSTARLPSLLHSKPTWNFDNLKNLAENDVTDNGEYYYSEESSDDDLVANESDDEDLTDRITSAPYGQGSDSIEDTQDRSCVNESTTHGVTDEGSDEILPLENGGGDATNQKTDSDLDWGFTDGFVGSGMEEKEIEVGIVAGYSSTPVNIATSEWFVVQLDFGYKFLARKSVLASSTHYFRAMFHQTSNWRKTRSGIVRLEDCDVSIFKIFARWINTGDVEVVEEKEHSAEVFDDCDKSEQFEECGSHFAWLSKDGLAPLPMSLEIKSLIKAWKSAAYLICPAFQNVVMNELIKLYSESVIPVYNLYELWESEHTSSPLRLMVVNALRGSETSSLVGMEHQSRWFVYTCDLHVRPGGLEHVPCPEPRLSSADRYDCNGNLW